MIEGEPNGREEEGARHRPGREIHVWRVTASSRRRPGPQGGETPSRPLRVAAGSLRMELEVGGGFHALKVGGDAV
jgi:hypothetical protein